VNCKAVFVLLGMGLALPLFAANPTASENVTVAQLEQRLAGAKAAPDAELAQQLEKMQLSERISTAKLKHLKADLPGNKSQEALEALADSSVFLDPPSNEIPTDPTPDPATLRQMMVAIVSYVNTTVRQLPNFIARRDTTGFEDRQAEDVQEATAVVSYSYLPLHVVGRSSATVMYRDRQEQVETGAGKSRKIGSQMHGLVTAGEFGPILSTVVGDAIKGKITWGHWERSADGTEAVFKYSVPKNQSHYVMQFCCISDNVSDNLNTHLYTERAGYHGEIAFNPKDGTILRVSAEAELAPGELVAQAGMQVEYGPVEIGGKNFICPAKSVSVLKAHTEHPKPGMHMAVYDGVPKTFLNYVMFGQYQQFRGEVRILNEDASNPEGTSPRIQPTTAQPDGPGASPTH
jgi:hypothetical protein